MFLEKFRSNLHSHTKQNSIISIIRSEANVSTITVDESAYLPILMPTSNSILISTHSDRQSHLYYTSDNYSLHHLSTLNILIQRLFILIPTICLFIDSTGNWHLYDETLHSFKKASMSNLIGNIGLCQRIQASIPVFYSVSTHSIVSTRFGHCLYNYELTQNVELKEEINGLFCLQISNRNPMVVVSCLNSSISFEVQPDKLVETNALHRDNSKTLAVGFSSHSSSLIQITQLLFH
jgi:hypothetical protein